MLGIQNKTDAKQRVLLVVVETVVFAVWDLNSGLAFARQMLCLQRFLLWLFWR
jgi:hypothetical protein